MNILGMGLVFSGGRGIEAFNQSLQNGWKPPKAVTIGKSNVPVFLVDLERIQDKSALKKLRRADKLSKMAVLAATDAVLDSGLGDAERGRLGIIVATAFGAHVTTFEFLDGILEYGETAVSPTVFSNSVHNAAASYISSALGIQGPTLTITRFFFSFQSALQLADAWLREGRLEHVLVGAADQFGDVMGYISENRLNLARDGKIDQRAGTAVPGEGAAFFVLSRTASGRGYCSVGDIRFGSEFQNGPPPDLDVLDADGLIADQSVYSRFGSSRTGVYAPVYGSMMVGSAFSIAAAGLMIKSQACFPDPLNGSLPRRSEGRELADSSIDFVRCIRYNCSHYGCSIDIRNAE